MGEDEGKLQSFRELTVWQKAMDLVEEVYRVTAAFPDDERFGLTSQMRRAAVSVPSNIAEGYSRRHRGDYVHHLSIAAGSRGELETQLILAGRLNYIDQAAARPCWNLLQEVGRMLTTLTARLQST